MRVTDLDKIVKLKLLVYGDSGSGKTTLIGTATQCEATSPLLVLNARGQPISLRQFDPRPLVLDVESMGDFNFVYRWIVAGQPPDQAASPIPAYLESVGADRFGSVAIDSITHVQRLALDELVGSTGIGPGDIPPQTQIQHWGRVLAQLTNLSDLFFRLPIHVFVTALTRRDEIPAFGYTLFAPFLWGQASMEVPAHAEIVGRLMNTAAVPMGELAKIKRAASRAGAELPFNMLFLAGGRDFIAKWQGVPDPPGIMPAPTVQKLYDKLQG